MTVSLERNDNRISNEEIISRYLQRFSHSKAARTTRKYGLAYFFDQRYFGYQGHIFDIKKRDLIDYFDYLNHLESICLQTKVNKWSLLRSFLKFIMEYYYGFLVVIPKHCISWKPIHKKANSNKNVVMTKDEVKKILDFNFRYNYKYYVLLRLLAETGMRIGELLKIDMDDVNIEKRYVETVGKTGRKIYYFTKGLAKHLDLYLRERQLKNADCRALFIAIQKRRYARRSINGHIKRCLKELDLKKRISSHTFRRTLNTLRKRMGCPKEDRKILLCHKVGDVNYQCYVRLNYNDYIALYDKWNPYKDYFDN